MVLLKSSFFIVCMDLDVIVTYTTRLLILVRVHAFLCLCPCLLLSRRLKKSLVFCGRWQRHEG